VTSHAGFPPSPKETRARRPNACRWSTTRTRRLTRHCAIHDLYSTLSTVSRRLRVGRYSHRFTSHCRQGRRQLTTDPHRDRLGPFAEALAHAGGHLVRGEGRFLAPRSSAPWHSRATAGGSRRRPALARRTTASRRRRALRASVTSTCARKPKSPARGGPTPRSDFGRCGRRRLAQVRFVRRWGEPTQVARITLVTSVGCAEARKSATPGIPETRPRRSARPVPAPAVTTTATTPAGMRAAPRLRSPF